MGQIKLLIVMGEDADPEHTRNVVRWLQPEWFQVAVMGAPPGFSWDPAGLIPNVWEPFSAHSRGRAGALRAAVAGADVVDYQGFYALRDGFSVGLLDRCSIYTRMGVPRTMSQRQQEVWFMTHVGMSLASHASWAGYGARRMEPLTTVDLTPDGALAASPPSPLQREVARKTLGVQGPQLALAIWTPVGSVDCDVARAVQDVASAAGVTVWTFSERYWDTGDTRWSTITAASDIVCLPVKDVPCDQALPTAMTSGAAVVVSRVPGFIGRLKCPVEGLMLQLDPVAGWRETLDLLTKDRSLREDLAREAQRSTRLSGPARQVRILQGIYAGVLARATGRCPTCPPEVAAAAARR